MKKKWEEFESLAMEIQKELSPNSRVIHNHKVTGRDSGVERQIDIAIYDSIGQFNLFIAMECKAYKIRINVKTVESFVTMIEDIGANKGVIVTTVGYSDAAKKVASRHNIDLLKVVDTENETWRTDILFPIALSIKNLSKFSVGISSSYHAPLVIPRVDPRLLPIYSEKKKLMGLVVDLLIKEWNSKKLELRNGENSFILKNIRVKDENNYYPADIEIRYIVSEKAYCNDVKVSNVKGFINELDGKFLSRSVGTGIINLDELEKEWKTIDLAEYSKMERMLRLKTYEEYTIVKAMKTQNNIM